MLKLVKFSCDCIGTVPDDDGFSILVRTCDGRRDICFLRRDMGGKSYDALPLMQTNELIREIGKLISDGHSMWMVRTLLEQPKE